MNYRLSQHVELMERQGDYLLVSRSPLSILRLNSSLKDLISNGQDGLIAPVSLAEQDILEQLSAKGFVERVHESTSCTRLEMPTVSIIIPVKDRADELGRCLESLASVDYPNGLCQLIVVDDGSSDASPDVARQAGAIVIPSGGTGRGPAAARNVGARIATGDILAFIDSDCTASKGWLKELIPSFADSETVAVGGRVNGMSDESVVDRYEAVMSSLSLGNRELSGSIGDDTFYLPSCNLLVRRQAFLHAGGFNDEMHVGEDVDLTWRLRDKGWTIRYLPKGDIDHEHRSTIRSFMSRRFDYGTSEGMLQRLHPDRRKQMLVPPLFALLLALCLMAPFSGGWSLLAAAVVFITDVAAVKFKLFRRGAPIATTALLAARLRALGSLVYYLSYHLSRYYIFPLLSVSLLLPKFFPVPVFVMLCAAWVDHSVRKPQLSFVSYLRIYMLEQVAYGAGVFWGCLHNRCFDNYRISLMKQSCLLQKSA